MSSLRRKTLLKYVIPSILSNACIFLFTIVDGILVGTVCDPLCTLRQLSVLLPQ